jgi:hypothetical protein
MLTRTRAHPVFAVLAVIAVALLANGAVSWYRRSHERIDACGLLPSSVVRAVLGTDQPGERFEPEGGDDRATGCTFGRGGRSITVFASSHDAGSFARAKRLGEQHGAAFDEVDGDGYRAYWGPGPGVGGAPSSQDLSVLEGGHRAEVVLYGSTDTSIRPTVVAAVAAAL